MISSYSEQATNEPLLYNEYRFEKLSKCGESCYLILATINFNISAFFSIWIGFSFAFLYHWHHLPVERRIYCSIYEIQSIQGWKQGVMLHKALWVSNKPQNRILMLATHSFRIFPVLLLSLQQNWKCESVIQRLSVTCVKHFWHVSADADFLSKRPSVRDCYCLRMTSF